MRRVLFILAGVVSLILGAVGIVLPLLPTTPLVLLSAVCFSKSSKRLEAWLMKSRVFGGFIDNYRTGNGIGKMHKIGSLTWLWIGLITSVIVIRTIWGCVVLGIVGVGVTVHILMMKTKK